MSILIQTQLPRLLGVADIKQYVRDTFLSNNQRSTQESLAKRRLTFCKKENESANILFC